MLNTQGLLKKQFRVNVTIHFEKHIYPASICVKDLNRTYETMQNDVQSY